MYFAESGFYDRRCNNERVGGRTQELPSLTGLEYAVVTTEHPGQELIAVERRLRAGPEQTQAEAAYYILDGTIYQCPDLQTLLTSRLVWLGLGFCRIDEAVGRIWQFVDSLAAQGSGTLEGSHETVKSGCEVLTGGWIHVGEFGEWCWGTKYQWCNVTTRQQQTGGPCCGFVVSNYTVSVSREAGEAATCG